MCWLGRSHLRISSLLVFVAGHVSIRFGIHPSFLREYVLLQVNFFVWLIFATKMQKFAPDVLKIVVWELKHEVLSRCRAFGIEPIISSKAQIASYEIFFPECVSYLSSSCSITVKPLLVSSPISGKLNFDEIFFSPDCSRMHVKIARDKSARRTSSYAGSFLIQ